MTASAVLLLDRDGTLVSWDEMFIACVADACRQAGVAAPVPEVVLAYEFWEQLLADRLVVEGCRITVDSDAIPRRYLSAYGRPIPGAVPTMAELASTGVVTALVSSWTGTEATRALVDTWGIGDAFTLVLTSDDLAVTSPLSAVERKRLLLELALRELDPDLPRWMVGDSASDIEAGKQVGATTVAVLTGNGTRDFAHVGMVMPDHIVASLGDVPELIRRSRAGL
ncbi:HAD hydrolase-like protein [Nonomuraea phyllanthi]|uniref:HAD hydrolase-like protein n=1 Tax=Nonomuraea phyllanthi TaxID=2219224 RepID=A0A5C4UTI8_9ACTN|nr:HAD hydrolase-like protein [Nonomuraea phyllanthi]KAB8182117.1 HAD hydrolase-like protein [Nonomuraea phyllanthi]